MERNRHLDGLSDDELAQLARDGNADALERLLRSSYVTIHAVCRRIVVDRAGADDATQEALLAVARGVTRFDGRSSVKTWIYRIATNAALDEIRRHRRRPTVLRHRVGADPHGLASEPAASAEDGPEAVVEGMDRLSHLLSLLEPDFRATVALRYVADLEYSEIAATLGIPVGTVRSRLARARETLRPLLAGSDDGNSTGSPDRQNLRNGRTHGQ